MCASMYAEGSASLQSFVDILQSRADMYPPNVLCKLCLELPESQKGNDMTGLLLTCQHRPAGACYKNSLDKAVDLCQALPLSEIAT